MKKHFKNTLKLLILQTIKNKYFTIHVKINSPDDTLPQICEVGCE